MQRCLIRLTVLTPLALVCAGCSLGRLSFNYYDDDHHRYRPVRVARVHTAHVCTYDCNEHYWDGASVVVLTGHRHGPHCGHSWDGAHWMIVREGKARRAHRRHARVARVARVAHVHGPSCGHVFHSHGRKWIKIKRGHAHGHDCGHVFIEGRWTIRF
jgi:hypothetical protein